MTVRRMVWPAVTVSLASERVRPAGARSAASASVPANPLTPVAERSNVADPPCVTAAWVFSADRLKSGAVASKVSGTAAA